MKRENRKESIIKIHKSNILSAAEKLFIEKGFENTTIDDITKHSEYSRRTIYSYFSSKEEIYCNIVLNGLVVLKNRISDAIINSSNFMDQYKAICEAMTDYFMIAPQSFNEVNNYKSNKIDIDNIPAYMKEIFTVGEEMNKDLEQFIEDGKINRFVRQNVKVKETVLILWSNISGILTLVKNKGSYIEMSTGTSISEFLKYSFDQIISSIIEEEV